MAEDVEENSFTEEEDVAQCIEECVRPGSPAGLYHAKLRQVVRRIEETILKRQLNNIELAFVQRKYVQVVLKLWLDESLEKVDEEMKSTDFSTEMSALLKQLESIRCLRNIQLLDENSKLRSWCDGERLRLILGQIDVFETAPYSFTLVNNHFQQFKKSCTEKVFSQCLSDRDNAEKHLKFISALNEFLSYVNLDNRRPKMFADYFLQNYVVNDNSNGRELIQRLVERCDIHLNEDPSGVVEKFVESANSLAADEWTPRLQSLTKETCRKLLLPLLTTEIKREGERRIVVVKGIAILVSKIKKRMAQLKGESNAQEVQIVGLASIHVDCNLEREIWHGINVVVVTDKLFIDGDFHWDVSGQNRYAQLGTAPDGQLSGHDGLAGNHGLPGESGGNVYVICNEMLHAERWTIVSNGGCGSKGQNGGTGKDGVNGKDAPLKMSQSDFERDFPSMAKWAGGKAGSGVNTTLRTLERILPTESRTFGKDIRPGNHRDCFFIEGIPNDIDTITISFFSKRVILVGRDSVILCKGRRGESGQKGGKGGQGGKGGHGGYEGIITIESILGEQVFAPICKGTRGDFGLKGKDGEGGKHGKHGKSAGDVGFIDKVGGCSKLTYKPRFFGFENNSVLRIDYSSRKPDSEPYAQCYPHGEGLRYATIEHTSRPVTDLGTQEEKTTKGRLSRTERETEAIRKKAVTRQSLGQHMTQIMERKQMSESLQANMASMMETSQNADVNLNERATVQEENENECEIKLAFVRRMDSQRLETTSSTLKNKLKDTRLAEDVYDPLNSENAVQGSTFCPLCFSRQVVNKLEEAKEHPIQNTPVRLSPNVLVRCLERLSTRDGVDNLLHCIFGQKESFGSYLCKKTESYRKHITAYIRANGTTNFHIFSSLIKRFVFEVKEDDKDFPVANAKREEYLKFKDDHQLWKTVERVQNELKKEIVKSENKKLMKLLEKHGETPEEKVNYVLNRYWSEEEEDNERDMKAWDEAWSSCSQHFKKVVKSLERKFDWKEVAKSTTLMEEYAKFVESPLTTLGRSELELIALIYGMKIHIYVVDDANAQNNNDDENSPPFKFNETLNSDGGVEEHFILYEGKGTWQKLDVNPKLRHFLEERHRQAATLRQQTDTVPVNAEMDPSSTDPDRASPREGTAIAAEFNKLSSWFEKNYTRNRQVITSILMLNPQYGDTPDVLCKLLWRHLTPNNQTSISPDVSLIDEFASDICSLSRQVLDHNNRDLDPIFYLHIVDKFCPHRWKYEFLLQEMEEKMLVVLQSDERKTWRRALYKLSSRMISLLRDRLIASGIGNSCLTTEKLGRTLKMLADDLLFTEDDITRLGHLTLNDWFFELKSKMWEKQVNNLSSLKRIEDKKEVVYLLLELENKKGELFCHNLIRECQGPPLMSGSDIVKLLQQRLYSDGSSSLNSEQERTFEDIISVMKTDGNTSTGVESQLGDVEVNVLISKSEEMTLKKIKWVGRFDSLPLEDIKYWALKEAENKAKDLSLAEFLFVYDRAIELKMRFRLRDTQRVTITSLLHNKTSSLAQVSTGEGKSLIVAGVAIYRALCGLKINVITSNGVLALRDSNTSVADGGLRDLYEAFGVSVSNNCSEVEDDRVRCYDCSVVYGELSNFQRDYLLDTFYGRNIRGDRRFDCVIVDEVDCMLLDRGNNMLYLSHDIPGMEMLESLYVFIWEKIRTSRASLEQIKSEVLYDLFGAITKDDLEAIDSSLKNNPSEKNAIWAYLIKNDILDERGRLKVENVEKMKNKIKYNARLNHKLVYYLRNVIERDRRIRIPWQLLPFVDQHLESWLANAVRALVLNADEHYVVDQDRTGTSPDLNPQVIIIDPDTGTDQTTSQWDGALHQLLQLKEGCQISMQSLKAVFVSNVTFIKRYAKLTGLTGTLGSQPERDFLQQTYECDYFTLPTAYPKVFTVKQAQVVKTEDKWLETIANETRQTVLNDKARSMVIFCKSINDVKMTHQRLREEFTTEISAKKMKIHCYTRDYEKFEFESNEMDVGHVIVATNLAGRGTDIKISNKLRDNGGLHICLTYLPDNVRIEEQALGRAGRKGAPGSGILILCESPETSSDTATDYWGSCKIFDMKEERNRQELQRISSLADDFFRNIGKQEKCFELFSRHYAKLKRQLDESKDKVEIDMISFSALDQWALWLDSVDDGHTFESMSVEKVLKRLKDELIDKLELSSDIKWVTPARSIVIAKQLATRKKNPDLSMAATLLDRLIESKDQNFFYPAAHYYRALVIVKEGNFRNKKTKFFQTLRAAEAILEQHINLQMSYSQTVTQTMTKSDGGNSFCVIDAYKQQKENATKIMEHFQNSIRSLLGSHCSVSGLQEAGIDEAKADAYFEQLESSSSIVCHVNSLGSIPNRDSAIQQIADDYGVKKSSLIQFLNENQTNLSENKMEKNLKNSGVIQCNRKAFWNLLVKAKVLDDVHKCAVLTKSDCDGIHGLDQSRKINDEIGINCYILYNPTYSSQKELLEQNKVLFHKDYLKSILTTKEYRRKKKRFESNKIARINLNKLKTVDLRALGQLNLEMLNQSTKIHPDECQQIWNALKAQRIIDQQGNLDQNYKDQQFSYPECPIYENPVRRLVERTFLAELVRRQWLNEKDPDRLKAIADLALKPYQDLLADLMGAHIISGAQVNEKKDADDLENAAKEITKDKQDRDRIVSFLKNHQAVFAALETPDAALESIEPSIRQRSDMSNISTELYVFRLLGFDHVIQMKEEKRSWKMILRASLIIVFGVAQVALGALIQMKFAGLMTHTASGLMSEGISDILFAMSALWSGNNFTWADYGRHKLMSIAITASTMGIAAVFSRGVKFFKYGFKTVGPGFKEGGKIVAQSASAMKLTTGTIVKQVVKTTCIKIGQSVGFGLLNKQIESIVNSQLANICCALGTKLIEDINKEVVQNFTNMKETLNRLYRLYGPAEAQRLVSEKMQQVTTGWVQKGQEWLSKIVGSVASGLSEALNKRQMVGAASSAFKIATKVLNIISKCVDKFSVVIKLVDLMVTRTTQFHSELKKCNDKSTKELGNVDAREVERFQQKVQDDMKTALGREAGQMIESWTTQMLQNAAKQVVTMSARTIKKVHQERKEKGYREELLKLQEERRKASQSSGEEGSSEGPVHSPSEAHVKACLILMRKTKDPKLFAALIREGVPADRFCADALTSALPAVLQKFGVDNANVAVRIESSDGHFVHESDPANPDAIVIKVERAVNGQSMGHYYSSNDASDPAGNSANGYDCMFECLANQIKATYNLELDPTRLREVAATMVDKDQSVSQAIRNGWHRYTLDKGFYGAGELYRSKKDSFGRCGDYGSMKMYSQKGEVEADHQPAKSMWKLHAKDNWVKNLNENDFPSMSIPRDLHKQTLNYAGKAKISSEFNMQQKKLMQEGKYAEAMFHAVDKNWLEPIFRNESAEVIDKVYNNLTSDYLNSALNANTIDHHEVEDLRRRFTQKYNEATAIKARKRAQQWSS